MNPWEFDVLGALAVFSAGILSYPLGAYLVRVLRRQHKSIQVTAAGLVLGLLGLSLAWAADGFQSTSPALDPLAQNELLKQKRFPEGVIEVAPPDPAYVCHDFAFFGGPHPGDYHVEDLLRDYHYQPVARPQPGDLIIYRHGDEIPHSGIVKATGLDGFVLVESKWGGLGRFLHRPELKDMNFTYSFYRRASAGPEASH